MSSIANNSWCTQMAVCISECRQGLNVPFVSVPVMRSVASPPVSGQLALSPSSCYPPFLKSLQRMFIYAARNVCHYITSSHLLLLLVFARHMSPSWSSSSAGRTLQVIMINNLNFLCSASVRLVSQVFNRRVSLIEFS